MSKNSPQRHKDHKEKREGIDLSRRVLCFFVMMVAPLNLAMAQQPMAPSFPPITPNLARLDQTLGGLDGPGFALAYNESAGTLAAACEGQSIHYWDKSVIFGIRGGSGTPHVLKEHQGPVTALA